MKVLILGRGVIGSQYGWALEQAGHRVDFLVRKKASPYSDTLELHTYDGRKKTKLYRRNCLFQQTALPNLHGALYSLPHSDLSARYYYSFPIL